MGSIMISSDEEDEKTSVEETVVADADAQRAVTPLSVSGQSSFSHIPGLSQPLSAEGLSRSIPLHFILADCILYILEDAHLLELEQTFALSSYVATVMAQPTPSGMNPFDDAINNGHGTDLVFTKRSRSSNQYSAYVCFGGGPKVGIWTKWSALLVANPNRLSPKRFGRGFPSINAAKHALKLVKLYGGVNKDYTWDCGYWVVLQGQQPGWCYGR